MCLRQPPRFGPLPSLPMSFRSSVPPRIFRSASYTGSLHIRVPNHSKFSAIAKIGRQSRAIPGIETLFCPAGPGVAVWGVGVRVAVVDEFGVGDKVGTVGEADAMGVEDGTDVWVADGVAEEVGADVGLLSIALRFTVAVIEVSVRSAPNKPLMKNRVFPEFWHGPTNPCSIARK